MEYDALVQKMRGTLEEEALLWLRDHEDFPLAAPPGFSDEDKREVEQNFIDYELIDNEIGTTPEWIFTARGRRLADYLFKARTTGSGRRARIEKALLRHIESDQPQWVEDFGDREVDGIPIGERAAEIALEHLVEFGLVRGTSTTADGSVMLPRLTPSGRAALDDPRDPFEFVRQGGTIVNDYRNHLENHGTMGVGAAGPGSVQIGNSFSSQSVNEVRSLVSEIQKELERIGGDVPLAAASAVEQLQIEAANEQPDASKLNALVASFTGAIATKFAEDAYSRIPDLIGKLGVLLSSLF